MNEHSVNEFRIKVHRTARICIWGNTLNPKYVWICAHGYGQLARYFIAPFTHLNSAEHLVICPEGLNRFYLQEPPGRVGATWMTKEDRLTDIDDYLNYLDQTFETATKQFQSDQYKVIAFGFSQGVATISRWINHTTVPIDYAVFWAGSFPPDMDPIEAAHTFGSLKTFCIAGTKDPYLTPDAIEGSKRHFLELKITPEWIRYPGDHRVVPNILSDFAKKHIL